MPAQLDPQLVAAFEAEHDFGLADSLVGLCYAGSRTHHTALDAEAAAGLPGAEHSSGDTDYFLVVLPPARVGLGLDGFTHWSHVSETLDVSAYSLARLVELLVKGAPAAHAALWVDACHTVAGSDLWDALRAARGGFLSQAMAPSVTGWARDTMKRLARPVPGPAALQGPEWEAVVAGCARAGWAVEDVVAGRHTPMPRDRQMTSADIQLLRRRAQRFAPALGHGAMGERRRELIQRVGYDCRAAVHVVRLLRMTAEVLETGVLTVGRQADARELRDIKRGTWTLEQVRLSAEHEHARIQAALRTTALPERVNRRWASDLLARLTLTAYVRAAAHEPPRPRARPTR